MTTCNDVVRTAMQRLRLLGIGEVASAAEAADGLSVLQSLYDGWSTRGLFGRLNAVIPSANYTAREWDRVVNSGGYVITLPTTITDTALPFQYTVPGTWGYVGDTPRPPYDLAQIEVVAAGVSQRSIYDAHKGAWVRLDSLALTDAAPLATRGQDGLAACLAIAWADDFGAAVQPATQQRAALFMAELSYKLGSVRRPAMQDYF